MSVILSEMACAIIMWSFGSLCPYMGVRFSIVCKCRLSTGTISISYDLSMDSKSVPLRNTMSPRCTRWISAITHVVEVHSILEKICFFDFSWQLFDICPYKKQDIRIKVISHNLFTLELLSNYNVLLLISAFLFLSNVHLFLKVFLVQLVLFAICCWLQLLP